VAETLVDLWPETVLGADDSALAHLSRFDLARIVGGNRSAVSVICSDFERRGWCRLLGRPGASIDPAPLGAYASNGLRPLAARPRDRLHRHQRALWRILEQLEAIDVA
jgi:hypothetical protein